MTLPPANRAEVRRILDAAARRLLAEKLDGDPLGTAPAGSHRRSGNGGPDQSPAFIDRKSVPVSPGPDHDCRVKAA